MRADEEVDDAVPPGKVFSPHQIRMIEAIAGRMEEGEPVGRQRAERALGAMALGIMVEMRLQEQDQRRVAVQVARLRERAGVE